MDMTELCIHLGKKGGTLGKVKQLGSSLLSWPLVTIPRAERSRFAELSMSPGAGCRYSHKKQTHKQIRHHPYELNAPEVWRLGRTGSVSRLFSDFYLCKVRILSLQPP